MSYGVGDESESDGEFTEFRENVDNAMYQPDEFVERTVREEAVPSEPD